MINVGYIRLKVLLERLGTIEKIFGASESELKSVEGIGPALARNIVEAQKKFDVSKESELIEKRGVKVVTIFDENYPKNLKEIYDPPIVLYVKGEIAHEDEAAVAIVGSRRATYYGNSTAERLGWELASRGVTVVSGMARGIDTAAHRGALKVKGRTIAVLGSGLANIYPPENRKLADEIESSGAVVSEFPMEEEPYKANFPQRNRTISGLSLGVVVVEAPQISGALITARFAMEQNREVFAVPGQAKAFSAKGTNQLIRDGAKLVEGADDIIEELKPRLENFLQSRIAANVKSRGDHVPLRDQNADDRGLNTDMRRFSEEENKVLSILSHEPIHIDHISSILDLPINEVSSALTQLMIAGLIKELPGKNFVRLLW